MDDTKSPPAAPAPIPADLPWLRDHIGGLALDLAQAQGIAKASAQQVMALTARNAELEKRVAEQAEALRALTARQGGRRAAKAAGR